MRTVPLCALDSVDAATMISAPANMAAPNFMARKNPSIVASQRLLLTSQLIKVREFSRPVEGVNDLGDETRSAISPHRAQNAPHIPRLTRYSLTLTCPPLVAFHILSPACLHSVGAVLTS